MRNFIVIKSYKNGLAICLDSEPDFDDLCRVVADKFRESAAFFGNAQVALSFEGRTLSKEEENRLVDIITQNSDLRVACVVGKDARKDQLFLQSADAFGRLFAKSKEGGKFYRGSLRDGQVLEAADDVVVAGDVEEGCSVMAAGNVVILGALQGSAMAGSDGGGGRFIFAMEMNPQKLRIGGRRYKGREKEKAGLFGSRKGRHKAGKGACVAFLMDGEVQMREFSPGIWDEIESANG